MQVLIPEQVCKQAKRLEESDRPAFDSFMGIVRNLSILNKWSEKPENLTTWGGSGLGGKVEKIDLLNNKYRIFVQPFDETSLLLFQLLNHEDADKYINKHKSRSNVNKIIKSNKNYIQSIEPPSAEEIHDHPAEGNLISKLSPNSKNILLNIIVKSESTKNLLLRYEAKDFNEIDSILASEENKKIIKRIFNYLSHDSFRTDAESLIVSFERRIISSDVDDIEILNIDNYEHANQLIRINSPEELDELKEKIIRASNNLNWRDWMLFLTADQEVIATDNYAGTTRLLGVSGSGKTAILIKRAEYLSKIYPNEGILIVTLNKSLATLITDLLNTAIIDTHILSNINVKCHFDLCKELLTNFGENSNLLNEFSHLHKDHIDAIWKEFYIDENNPTKQVKPLLKNIHDKLLATNIFPENYIREEFDWIRSSYESIEDISHNYPKTKREGRKTPLAEELRYDLISALGLWNEKQLNIGVNDKLRLTSILLSKYKPQLTSKYRSILIDECQDFGTTELMLLRSLTNENANDLFLCGDFAQKISYKNQDYSKAGINLKSTKKINRNYRNTLQILEFATNILDNQSAEVKVQRKGLDIFSPELAYRQGQLPEIVRAQSMEDEFAYALSYMKYKANSNELFKGCIAICGYSEYEVMEFAHLVGIQHLNGLTTLDNQQIFLSDLENTKGFEFNDVIIINCSYRSDSNYPDTISSPEEKSTEFNRLYVAMTRAKDFLVITHIRTPSDFISDSIQNKLRNLYTKFSLENSSNKLPFNINAKYKCKPKRIDKLFSDGSKNPPFKLRANVLEMSWEEFLYTKYAIGLETKITKTLRTLGSRYKNVNILNNPLEVSAFRKIFQSKHINEIEEKIRLAKQNEKSG